MNAKLADLELGVDSKIQETEDESPFQKDFLANWIPPEVVGFFKILIIPGITWGSRHTIFGYLFSGSCPLGNYFWQNSLS